MDEPPIDLVPCEDCKWKLLIQTGRPIFLIYCKHCHRWYQASSATQRDPVEWHDWLITVGTNWTDVNELFRCDVIAHQLYLSHTAQCSVCVGEENFSTKLRVQLMMPFSHTLQTLTFQIYKQLNLPAYTLQRRCGAHLPFAVTYCHVLPDNVEKVRKYLEQRERERAKFRKQHPGLFEEREAFDAPGNSRPGSAELLEIFRRPTDRTPGQSP